MTADRDGARGKTAAISGAAALILAGLAAACAAGPDAAPETRFLPDSAPAEPARVAEGRAIAETQCAACHAIDAAGESPYPGAPALRTVLARYNTATLELDLMEGMRIGHTDMPRFTFDPLTADSLIAWLEWVQEPQPRR